MAPAMQPHACGSSPPCRSVDLSCASNGSGKRCQSRNSAAWSERQRPRLRQTSGLRLEDRIVVESDSTAQSSRAGAIDEVLSEDPPCFRVRWDDGRTTIFAPSAGGRAVVHRKKQSAKA